jgi:hypothetical protein
MNKISLIALAIAFVVGIPIFASIPYAHSSGSATLSVGPVPSRVISTKTGNFNLTIHLDGVTNLWSWKVNVTWDPTVLSLVSPAIEGPFMSSAGSTWFVVAPNRTGEIPEMSDTFLSTTSVTGSGDLAYLTFAAVNASNYNYASGGSQVNITTTVMLDPAYNNIAYITSNCTVHVAMVGDITGQNGYPDGQVNLMDVYAVALAFGSSPGDRTWNINCDINNDGTINLKDYYAVCLSFGNTA